MKSDEAKQLVEQTFKKSFSKDNFDGFIRNLLQGVEPSSTSVIAGAQLPKGFEDHIVSITRLGKYVDPTGDVLDALAVKLKNPASLDRARTRQRNLMAHYLATRNKDAALVAFYSDDYPDWRFSFVRLAYEADTGDDGLTKTKKKFTPARRFSFLVGESEPSHTAQQQLIPLLEQEAPLRIGEIEDAFNIEAVTTDFFKDYKELYLKIKDEVDAQIIKNSAIQKEFNRCAMDTIGFARKLLGQIVFLYFVQKKGWLGVPENAKWGDGDKDFLYNLYLQRGKRNYFKDILEPLFYEALALERPEDFYENLTCKVPFLNGGLFEPLNNYRWKTTPLLISDKIFAEVFRIFNLYNFTVREDEPLEKEVAVDPEMLGKVFENLLEIRDRKSKGAFYTPREVVHYMCQVSLVSYLNKAANAETKLVSHVDIEKFVHLGDSSLENDLAKESGLKKSGTYGLPKAIQEHCAKLDELLANIRICDPAIGSGAFPVGMMAEIVRARSALTPYLAQKKARTPYDFKWQCIERNIYGVDIDASAVEIAKLRLWLSLVVDEENYDRIRPLPNLDYKIACGNSLLLVEQNLFNKYTLYPELNRKKIEFFSATSQKHKEKLRSEIKLLIDQLTEGKKIFDFEAYFSEVFSEKEGFDIVIGNPPYLEARSSEFSNDMKDELQSNLRKRLFKKAALIPRGSDLLIYFLELGIQIINSTGTVVQITQNAWLNTEYGAKFQSFLLRNTQVDFIIDSDYKYFDTANVNTIITIFSGKGATIAPVGLVRYRVSYPDLGLFGLVHGEKMSPGADLKIIEPESGLLAAFKWGVLLACDSNFIEVLRKLEKVALRFDRTPGPQFAIGQGLNLANSFIFSSEETKELALPPESLVPFFSGRFVPRFRLSESLTFLADKARISGQELGRLKDHGKSAFDFQTTRKRPPLLIMPRGIGSKHYCAVNEAGGFSDSGVEIYDNSGLASREQVLGLWAFYNSTLFWLIRELSGRKNLGGGMLKAEAVDIRDIPALLNIQDTPKVEAIFQSVAERPVRDALDELQTIEHKEIDALVFDSLNMTVSNRTGIKELFVRQINERNAKAQT